MINSDQAIKQSSNQAIKQSSNQAIKQFNSIKVGFMAMLALLTVFSFGLSKVSADEVQNTEPEYVLATDDDFENIRIGNTTSLTYKGNADYVEIPNTIKGEDVTSYYRMFYNTSVKGVKSTNDKVTNMTQMFMFSKATELDLSELGTTSVTTMTNMFSNSQATELDLSNFDTSNVTDMNGMFRNSQATELDLGNFDTTNVTDMVGMFYGSQATELDLSNFDTSNVTDMNGMFRNSQATVLDLSKFDTSNVTSMASMFQNSQATELDLSKFDASNVTSTNYMFKGSQATTGYARTQEDAKKFNSTNSKPGGLIFEVKTQTEPTDPTDPEVPGEGSTTGSNDVFFELGTGGLFLETSPINGFGVIPLTGSIEHYTTSFQNPFKVTDLRGTLEGWKINVSASQFKVVEPEAGFVEGTEANVLPTGTLLLSDGVEVESIDPQATELPKGTLTGNTIIDSGSVQVVEALPGEGAGEYNITFSDEALTLVIDPATAKVDTVNYLGGNTPYESTLTWDLVSAP